MAFSGFALAHAPIDCLRALWVSPRFAELRLAPVDWRQIIAARLLAQWLVRPAPVLALLSPSLLRLVLFHSPRALLGYFALPILALAGYALGWSLITPILFKVGAHTSQFIAQSWRFLVLSGAALLLIRQPGWVETVFGWWIYAGSLVPGAVLTLTVTALALMLALRTLPAYAPQHIPLVTPRTLDRVSLQGNGSVLLLRKEALALLRIPRFWSGLLVFPVLHVLVAVAGFGNEPLFFMADMAVFGPSIFAVVVADYLVQHDRAHLPFLLLSPTPPGRLLLVKTVLTTLISLPLIVAGAATAPPAPHVRVVVAMTGLVSTVYSAYVACRQGMLRVLADPGFVVAALFPFLVVVFMSVGAGLYVAQNKGVAVAYLLAALCALPPLGGKIGLPLQRLPPASGGDGEA